LSTQCDIVNCVSTSSNCRFYAEDQRASYEAESLDLV